MALIPKISLCSKDNCKELLLKDITGTYNVTTNPTGWGAPNLALAGVTEATISITIPGHDDAVELDVTSTVTAATIIDGVFVLDTLTMDGDFDGDEDEQFPDGIYEITYTIVGGGTTYTHSITTFSTCQTACCLEKMKTKFEEKMCGCEWEDYFMNYLRAKAMLNGAKRAYACGDTDKAESLLAAVEKICKNSKCNC